MQQSHKQWGSVHRRQCPMVTFSCSTVQVSSERHKLTLNSIASVVKKATIMRLLKIR